MSDALFSDFDHLLAPTVVLNINKEIIYFNNAFSTFTSLSPRILRSCKYFPEIFSGEDFSVEKWISESTLAFQAVVSPEVKINQVKEKENAYFVVMKLFPIKKEDKNYFGITINDMSIEKNLFDKYKNQMEELKTSHMQILQADKLTTLGEMTANISHEISNPLTIASGNRELIDYYLESDDLNNQKEPIIKANKDIKEALTRINDIIVNMKKFLHKSEDEKEYCGLDEIIKSASEWVSSHLKDSGVKIKTLIKDKDIVIFANQLKIEQVVINLLKNAIDAMTEAHTESALIEVIVERQTDNGQLNLDIIDNGPGIAAKNINEVFEPFFTTKGVGKGTGLGLSICDKIMKSHHGSLVALPCDHGAHFRLTFPAVEGYSISYNQISESDENEKDANEKRILVLDNEASILNVFKHFLEDEGHFFLGATNPLEALKLLQTTEVDIVITDLMMPEINGRNFSNIARKNGYKGKIVYMSGQKNKEVFEKDKDNLKISSMIIKPFTKDDITKVIKEI